MASSRFSASWAPEMAYSPLKMKNGTPLIPTERARSSDWLMCACKSASPMAYVIRASSSPASRATRISVCVSVKSRLAMK